MPHYALLNNPGHNRVYFRESLTLAAAELALALPVLSVECGGIEPREFAGIPYLTFGAAQELTDADVGILYRLSFVYAVYACAQGGALIPTGPKPEPFMDESVGTILKYTGKTNELFTRMMIGAAGFSTGSREFAGMRLLDPLAGKGTTLFQGLIGGMDVYGVEIGARAVDEACNFLEKYLQTEKYKHTTKTERVSGENKSFTARRRRFEIARDRDAAKRGETRVFEMVAGDSRYVNRYYKKDFFDIIVGDLPYGVKHGSVTNEGQSSLTRNPEELLRVCLPAWKAVLKPGGALALSWNINVLPREKIIAVLTGAGFKTLTGGAYDGFRHRVDQAILRDLVIARQKDA